MGSYGGDPNCLAKMALDNNPSWSGISPHCNDVASRYHLSSPTAKQEKKSKKGGKKSKAEVRKVEINEQKIDLLLDMMRGADVTDGNQAESETLLEMEGETPASLLHSLHCMGSVEWGHIVCDSRVSYSFI